METITHKVEILSRYLDKFLFLSFKKNTAQQVADNYSQE